jgi:hypothetical protein
MKFADKYYENEVLNDKDKDDRLYGEDELWYNAGSIAYYTLLSSIEFLGFFAK